MADFGLGLKLMLIGMISVFIILLIIIYSSQLLIKVINRCLRENDSIGSGSGPTSADASTRRILEAAVERITSGKGHITNITRI